MKGQIQVSLNIKDLIVFVLLILIILFSIIRVIQVNSWIQASGQANQVKMNAQNIQGIVDWIKQQEALKKSVDLTELVGKKEKEKSE